MKNEMISQIQKVMPDIVGDVAITEKYTEYRQKISDYSDKYDAVWVLAPFGVMDETGKKWVASSRVQSFLDKLDKPTIGWGGIGDLKRTVEMGISPNFLGQNAAFSLLNLIKDDQISVDKVTSYNIRCNEAHLKKLRIQVPSELIGAINYR